MKHEFSLVCPHKKSHKFEKGSYENFGHNEFTKITKYSNLPIPQISISKDKFNFEPFAFINQYGLEKICIDFKLKCKRHRKYPNLVSLHYTVSSDLTKTISCSTRCLIMDEDNLWNIVSLPYYKFKNCNKKEDNCLKLIELGSSRVNELLDGSLAVLYHYNNEWMVSSKS